MSNINKQPITKAEIEHLSLPAGYRKVIIRIDHKVTDETTESGILKISEADSDWQPSVHSTRRGVVVKVQRNPLPFTEGGDLMPWQTVVEIHEGWEVYFDYLAGLNCDSFIDEEGTEYKLINYDDLYVGLTERMEGEDFDEQTTKDGKRYLRPLNGYHLFKRVEIEQSEFAINNETKYDDNYGIVAYVAKNNLAYENGMSSDHLTLQVGDKVRFNKIPIVFVEDEAHCSLDGGTMYRRAQARNVEMLWRDGEMILPQGKVLVERLEDEDVTPAGIILPKADHVLKNHRATVLISSHGEIPVGSELKYIKGSGQLIDYEGKKCRLLGESEILYVEKL